MPRPIVESGESAQLVVDHLLLDSPKRLVSLACIYRALEEQPLGTLGRANRCWRLLSEAPYRTHRPTPGCHHSRMLAVLSRAVSD